MAHTRALDQVKTWPVDAATAGVAAKDEILATTGPADVTFRWASVTKLLTALAVLVAAEEGTISLDEQAGPPGSTVRHLLAHASGLPLFGTDPLTTPGVRRIYSNSGFEVLADLVADRATMTFPDYLTAGVLEPLGLRSTVSTGSPASGAEGPLTDLLTLGRELLAPTLVSLETLTEATTVAFPNLAGVLPGFGRQEHNDWGLGFELRDHKSPHWTGTRNSPSTFGHFGQSGSFLWVDPPAGLACGSLADRNFGLWAAEAWPRLADSVLAEYTGSL